MFGLVEQSLALLLASIALTASVIANQANIEQLLTKGEAQYMTTLQTAYNTYVYDYTTDIGSLSLGQGASLKRGDGTMIAIASALQPTVGDLISLRLLQQGFSSTSPMRQQYTTTLTPQNCPGPTCLISGMMRANGSYRDASGTVRSDLVGDVVFNAGNDAGAAYSSDPTTVIGFGNSWHQANDLPGQPPAALFMRVGSSSAAGNSMYQFYRRDGLWPLTAALNGGGQDINDVVDVHAAGTVYASNVSATGAVAASGAVAAGTTLSAGDIAWPRVACSKATQVAGASDHSGLMLSCQSVGGVLQWMPIGGAKLWYGYYTVQTGWGVPNPNCPAGGTPGIVVTGQSMYVDPTAAINYPIAGAGPWVVYITDGNGNQIPGSAVANTYCAY